MFQPVPIHNGGHMTTKAQEALVCTNPECGAEYVVVKKGLLRIVNPYCSCGSEMKHTYHSPVLRVLNESKRKRVERMLPTSTYSLVEKG